MIDKPNIPQPVDSGGGGTQSADDANHVLMVRTKIDGGINAYPVSNAIIEMAESRPRVLGNVPTIQLMAAYTQHFTFQNLQLQNDIKQSQDENRTLSNSLHGEQTKTAVLREKIRAEVRNRPLRNVCITLGSAMVSWGIEQFASPNLKYPIGALLFGALLLALGWLTAPSPKELP